MSPASRPSASPPVPRGSAGVSPTLLLTVLGSAGSYPGPGDACSGYLVRSPRSTCVIDLGPGTLANLQRHVELSQIDAIVLTHEHPDHWLDVPILRNALRYYLGLEGLAVYGTAGAYRRAQALIGELEPTLEWTVIDASSSVRVGDQRFRFDRTDHPVETLAVRLEVGDAPRVAGRVDNDAGQRALAYSADTGPRWSAADLAHEADVFLCEATLAQGNDADELPHLNARQAGEWARALGVGTLLLTHVAPGVDPHAQKRAAESAFGGPVELARTHGSFMV